MGVAVMRIRSIRPEFWSSEDIAALPWNYRLIFIGLWSYVDDNGVGRDVERLILADLFPLDENQSAALKQIHGALSEFSSRGLITRYTVDGKPFVHVTTFSTNQVINRPSRGRYPLPTSANAEVIATLSEPSVSPHVNEVIGEGEKGRRGEGEKDDATHRAVSPRGSRMTIDWQPSEKCHDDLGVEFTDLDLPLELAAFRDHFLSKGETRKDWDAGFRNWCRNARKYASKSTPAKRTTNGLTDDQWQAAFERAQAADRAAGVLT